jgi:hypothetical protein
VKRVFLAVVGALAALIVGAAALAWGLVRSSLRLSQPARGQRGRDAQAVPDLAFVAALGIVAVALCVLVPHDLVVVRTPAALALILALPGYALTAAIFRPGQLPLAERLLLSLAFSIAATILSAAALAAAGVKLNVTPWMSCLGAVTLVGCIVGLRLGHARVLRMRRFHLRAVEVLALACSVVLLAGAAALGFTPLPPPSGTEGTTAFWIVPHGSGAVELGVISDAFHPASYTVELQVRGARARYFGPITLSPGAQWSTIAAVRAGKPAVQAELRAASRPTVVFRYVTLVPGWLSATAPLTGATAASARCSYADGALASARGCPGVPARSGRTRQRS